MAASFPDWPTAEAFDQSGSKASHRTRIAANLPIMQLLPKWGVAKA